MQRFSCSLSILSATLLLASSATLLVPRSAAARTPIVALEVDLGGGVEIGGGAGKAIYRNAPLDVRLTGELTLRTDMYLTMFGGAYLETYDRAGVGILGGVRIRPKSGALRVGAGFLGTIAPYTIGGGLASGGACMALGKKRSAHVCADLEADFFFFGDDLPNNKVAAQLLLMLGASFDAM